MFLVDNILIPISLLFRKDRKAYCALKQILGFYPRHLHYYKQALMHKSMQQRTADGKRVNNERLEFLGDAVLNSVVGDIVYHYFEGKKEGFLTSTRSKIVQRETLNKLAVEIGLDKLVKYGCLSSSHNNYIYGNAFEAFIGAIYIDRGYACCYKFIKERVIRKYIDLEKMSRKEVNFKSRLIEWCQKHKYEVSFELVEQRYDIDNNPIFQSVALIEGLSAGSGVGYSKKESQQLAAHTALNKIKKDSAFKESIEQAKAENHPAPIPPTTIEDDAQAASLSEADSHSTTLND